MENQIKFNNDHLNEISNKLSKYATDTIEKMKKLSEDLKMLDALIAKVPHEKNHKYEFYEGYLTIDRYNKKTPFRIFAKVYELGDVGIYKPLSEFNYEWRVRLFEYVPKFLESIMNPNKNERP